MQFLRAATLAAVFTSVLTICAPEARAQSTLTALATASSDGSLVEDAGRGARLVLRLSQAVPYRIFTLHDPYRMVVDFSEVDWTGFDATEFDKADRIEGARVGAFRPGWSRLVMDLAEPLAVDLARMERTESGAELTVSLKPVSAEKFAAKAGVPAAARFSRAGKVSDADGDRVPVSSGGPMRVVLDPGHGGIDPGAERDGQKEADLVLVFAQELRDSLVRSGGFEVVLTRESDRFVPLESRITIAREAGADVFLSLHADAISEGVAEGATIYTLADRATDRASRKLAERHDRADLLSGIDLTEQDDVIALVLMDMARTETTPRTEILADALVSSLSETVDMHKRPRMQAGFSVLKAPDIPSVLIELGFLSSDKDRANLNDQAWRARTAWAIRDGLNRWRTEDAERARNSRK